jgi:hypothetical protein
MPKRRDDIDVLPKRGSSHWKTMADGSVWQLDESVDYQPGDEDRTTNSARTWGRTHGYTVSVRTFDDYILIQFTKNP